MIVISVDMWLIKESLWRVASFQELKNKKVRI